MKVVHVCKSFYPNIGGEEKYIYQLAKEQIKSGLDVTVLTRGSKEYEVKDGIKIHRVDSGNKPVLRLLKSIFLMKEKLKEIEADVYHAHDWNNALICDFARKEFVTTVHGYGFLDEFWLTRWIAEATLSGSKRLIVNHKFLVDKYKRYNPKYIHAGISLEEYPYKKIKKNNVFLIVSNFSKARNVSTYIKGFKLLNDKKMKMIVAGEGIERKELESLSEGHNIKFLGYRSDIPELIDKSMIVCGGGLTAIESMAMGKPVIVNNAKDVKMIPSSMLIDSEEDFVKRVENINKNLNKASLDSYKFAIKEFDIKNVAIKYLEVYGK